MAVGFLGAEGFFGFGAFASPFFGAALDDCLESLPLEADVVFLAVFLSGVLPPFFASSFEPPLAGFFAVSLAAVFFSFSLDADFFGSFLAAAFSAFFCFSS